MREHLEVYDGQLLVYQSSYAPASAAFSLGRIAETRGDRDRALAHYGDALAFEERIGADALARRTRETIATLG